MSVLVGNSDLRRQLHDHLLRRIPDVQRISARFQKNKASLKDVYKVNWIILNFNFTPMFFLESLRVSVS